MKRLVAIMAVITALSAFNASARVEGYPVKGRVIDRITREGVPYAAVIIVGVEGSGVMTDSVGVFLFPELKPGVYQFSAIQMGYRTTVSPEYKVTPYTPWIEMEIDQDAAELTASTVRPSPCELLKVL